MEITAALVGARLVAGAFGRLIRRCTCPDRTDVQPEPGSASPLGASMESAAALRRIVARYDVTDISPGEFSQMLQELYQAGALTDGQYHELSQVRLDLDAAGAQLDESLDLVDFYAEKLDKAMESAAPWTTLTASPIEPLRRRFDWLEKLAVLQSAPDTSTLDAVA